MGLGRGTGQPLSAGAAGSSRRGRAEELAPEPGSAGETAGSAPHRETNGGPIMAGGRLPADRR